MHGGTDFGAAAGTPIRAIADGKVIISESNNGTGWGDHVQLEHANGMSSLYAHMSVRKVSVREVVKQGDIIGLVGSTGDSTGPHLHLEIRTDASLSHDTRIDPRSVMPFLPPLSQ